VIACAQLLLLTLALGGCPATSTSDANSATSDANATGDANDATTDPNATDSDPNATTETSWLDGSWRRPRSAAQRR